MIPACRAIALLLCFLSCASPVAAVLPERSVSTSRQFLVYGPNIRLRGAICDLAERTKQDILQLIGQRDGWSAPILIHARYPQANLPEMPRAALSLSQTGFGLKLQLDLIMAPDSGHPEIRRELLNAVLLEMMYRCVPNVPPGTTYARPPEWLLDGFQAHGRSMTGSWAKPVPAAKICSLKDFLRQRPHSLDALGRSLYRVYSAALVELLTHLPDGRQRLARFIADLSFAPDDGIAHLQSHFPELIDATGTLQQMWLAQIARLSNGQFYQLLSGKESERILNKLLSLRTSACSEENYQLHEFPIFIHDSLAKPALVRLGRDLRALAARASPTYRPAILEYEKVATLLAKGKTNRIAGRLARLSASRKSLSTQTRKIEDYLNWFEAARPFGPSGLFVDYMGAAELAGRSERRRDPLSVYLDVLETEFQN